MGKTKNLKFAEKVFKDLSYSDCHIAIISENWELVDQYCILSDSWIIVTDSSYQMNKILKIMNKYWNKIRVSLYKGFLSIYFNN
jgi:hypothetical protein